LKTFLCWSDVYDNDWLIILFLLSSIYFSQAFAFVETPCVDFANILTLSFYTHRSPKRKMAHDLTVIFALLGSTRVKAWWFSPYLYLFIATTSFNILIIYQIIPFQFPADNFDLLWLILFKRASSALSSSLA